MWILLNEESRTIDAGSFIKSLYLFKVKELCCNVIIIKNEPHPREIAKTYTER